MQNIDNAALWWNILFQDLGSSAQAKTPGVLGDTARHRLRALIELFFIVNKNSGANVLFEIGAHKGETSRRHVSVSPSNVAIAYEANKRVFDEVVQGGLPERMQYRHCAIGLKNEDVKFFVPVDEKYKVWGSTKKREGNIQIEENIIQMMTVDSAIEGLSCDKGRNISLWIDVEGAGLEVLKSAENSLKINICSIFVEVNDFSVYENSASALEIIEFLLSRDFIPVARDNNYGDAWNLFAVHSLVYYAERETITRWKYKHSGSNHVANVLISGAR